MVWYSHLFQNFPQLIVIHTVKGFGIVNKAEIDVFLLLFRCFSGYWQFDLWFLCLYTWTSPDGQHQNQIDYIVCRQNGEALYSQQKQDWELTVAQIMNPLLPNSVLNWIQYGKPLDHLVQSLNRVRFFHGKSKRVPAKHLFLLYWLCQSLWLCGSKSTVENSERDGNTRPPDLPLEKPICTSESNS